MTAPSLSLTSPITLLPEVSARLAEKFLQLGIRCLSDLVRHLPLRHEHEREEQTIAGASALIGPRHGSCAHIALRGELLAARVARGRKQRVEATLGDESGTIKLIWFNAPWVKRQVHPGVRAHVQGKVVRYGEWLEMTNPRLTILQQGQEPPTSEERFRPIYPATEELPSTAIERVIRAALPLLLPLIEEHLPEEFRARRGLPTLAEAYRMLHAPEELDEAHSGRRRLAFDELFLLQLGVMLRRRQSRITAKAPALRRSAAIDARILARLPFELTSDQRRVIDEIAADLRGEVPMNRLLQGDVGAGKTVVALYAMLLAVAAGQQAALMAPTELLAEQHFQSISGLLQGSEVRLALLTGTQPRSEREAVLSRLAAGEIDLLIGTHALLTEAVRFAALALVVIDEQHRFGVHQRAHLRTKSSAPEEEAPGGTEPSVEGTRSLVPHVLVMTATPIPRTLSLTIFGDLDVSTIHHLPAGRQPIVTRLVSPARRDEVYEFVARRVRGGEQCYIVVPAVEEGDLGLADVGSHRAWLEAGHFAGVPIEGMHGRLARAQREAIMARFRAGEIAALVATVVIEVGVDVPNASLMVVEHADRFGLAQLHQLRGRIGRGARQSLCVLLADPAGAEADARLATMVETTDGFQIAERDLEIRGPGELFGSRQSGLPPFVAAELPRDFSLLQLARRDAERWIEQSPELSRPGEALLRRRLMKSVGEALGLADVA